MNLQTNPLVKQVFAAGFKNILENTVYQKEIAEGNYLEVSELFYDTIQGEGFHLGAPAIFLRLQHCSLTCRWCDTMEVWRFGYKVAFSHLIGRMIETGVIDRLKNNHHLVITGGSPLLQQDRLVQFLSALLRVVGDPFFIEVENECTIMPSDDMLMWVDCWNNSPKLSNSGSLPIIAYQPPVIKALQNTNREVWFKFVVSGEEDWEEIQDKFIDTKLINRRQIILMPLGGTRQELQKNTEMAVNMAIQHGVIYRGREHVAIWDKKTGI